MSEVLIGVMKRVRGRPLSLESKKAIQARLDPSLSLLLSFLCFSLPLYLP